MDKNTHIKNKYTGGKWKASPTFLDVREDRDINRYVVHFHWQYSFFSVHLICLHSNVKNNTHKNISSQSVQKSQAFRERVVKRGWDDGNLEKIELPLMQTNKC